MNSPLPDEQFFMQDFHAERQLLNNIRHCLLDVNAKISVPDGLKFTFNPKISNVYVSLFQTGLNNIRWGSKKKSLAESLERVLHKLQSNKNFKEFDVANPQSCRILFEVVTEEKPCDPKRTTILQLNKHRLEPGIDGLKFHYKGQLIYYMPTDAIVHSLMSMKQVYNFLAKRTGIAKETSSISERVAIMRSLDTDFKLIRSFACISYGDEVLPLYRGYPVPVHLSKEKVRDCLLKSSDWILDNMKPNGQFLYYYDGTKDSEVDFQHPRMTDPTYYNILRHSGGTITLLRAYELSEEKKYLTGAKESVDFFLSVLRAHEYKGNYACYPFFNRKSKLGGAGIGLVALIHYYRLSKDTQYRKYIDGLVNHLLSRVSDSGEMIGYYIHPQYLEGKEIENPNEELKKELFSFYYPGEALLGLALYIKHFPDINEQFRNLILEKSKMALDFLIHERPNKYDYMFASLPSDGWLMQAIEEWVKIKGFKYQVYIDFVFDDGQAMIDNMYQEHNAPYFDYVGAYFYEYGEHAFPDGARCEGLIAAYYLARDLGDHERANHFMKYLVKAAKNLLYTYNTPQSCYAHENPAKSVNSFRFKMTRQWVRVDSVQHTACFYARLLPEITDTLIDQVQGAIKKGAQTKNKIIPANIEGYRVLKVLGKGGFSTVSLVQDPKDASKNFALKKLINPGNNYNRLERELGALKIINSYKHSISLYSAKKTHNNVCLLFDYASRGDLKKYIKKHGLFDEEEICKLTHDILDEVLFAQKNNVLHLDINPRNIIRYKGKYSLIDWGLCHEGPEVQTNVIKGNRVYLPPDIYNGQRTLSSEIYSLGCSLYYAVVGKHIFDLSVDDSPLEEKMYKHFYFPPELPINISAKVKWLLLRMLDKNPQTRASISEIEAIMQDDFTVSQETYSFNSEDTNIDLSDTFAVYKKMAEDGVYHAQGQLGVYYETGKYVQQNLSKAFAWYERAAEKNYSPAVCNFAMLFQKGKGVERNATKAHELFLGAAKQGHGRSQYYLAKMYEQGNGVEVNQNQAIHWYTESAKNSYKKAHTKLKKYRVDIFKDWQDYTWNKSD